VLLVRWIAGIGKAAPMSVRIVNDTFASGTEMVLLQGRDDRFKVRFRCEIGEYKTVGAAGRSRSYGP
jgi:hypothetical protein